MAQCILGKENTKDNYENKLNLIVSYYLNISEQLLGSF